MAKKKKLIKKSLKSRMSKFYSWEEILKTSSTYNLVIGGRNAGKSRDAKKEGIEWAWEKGELGSLIYRTDLGNETNTAILKYFEDMNEVIKKTTKGEYDRINVRARDLYFYKEEEDEEIEVQDKQGNWRTKIIKGQKKWGPRLGHVFFIDQETSYKSKIYPNVKWGIFEEVFISADSKQYYLHEEPTKLDSLISTIFRNTTDYRMLMIGNLHSTVNPYVFAWGIREIFKQEQGTIQIWELDSSVEDKKIQLSVENAINNNQQSIALTKKGQMQEKGEWETGQYLTPNVVDIKGFNNRYEFVFTYYGTSFLCQFMVKGSEMILYITRKTTEIKPNTRVIGDVPSLSIYYTRTFKPIVDRERIIFDLINQNKMVFGDNLTGEDFTVALRSFSKGR